MEGDKAKHAGRGINEKGDCVIRKEYCIHEEMGHHWRILSREVTGSISGVECLLLGSALPSWVFGKYLRD